MGVRYSQLKIFYYPEKIASLPKDNPEIQAPIHIRIKPTNVCNHNCWYCAYRAESMQLGQHMNRRDSIPEAKMMEIIDDIGEMGVKAVTFSGGGEPFTYPYLARAAERLAESGIHFASLTNGALLKGRVAEVFARHATWVRVSMDGWDGPSYAEYRRRPETEFVLVMNNIRDFRKLGGKCHLGVVIIVDQRNWPHLLPFVETLREAGVDSVKISPCIVSNDGEENQAYHREIFEPAREIIDGIVERFGGEEIEIFDAYHLLPTKFDKDYHWCPYLQVLPVIGADLNVYTCHDKAYNLDTGLLGSIRDRRFRDFWMNDKEKFFALDPSRDCRHHCCANTKNQSIHHLLSLDPEHRTFV